MDDTTFERMAYAIQVITGLLGHPYIPPEHFSPTSIYMTMLFLVKGDGMVLELAELSAEVGAQRNKVQYYDGSFDYLLEPELMDED